ncbi:SPOR domain-containing protein, partial [Flavobacteriales bacterium]|nr:SPOR domain-containing protein [Flavobacteriales bacterium]
YSIQLAVLRFPTTEFNQLNDLKVEITNGLYKYLVGNYIDLNDANAAMRKINNFGFKNAYIIKTSK